MRETPEPRTHELRRYTFTLLGGVLMIAAGLYTRSSDLHYHRPLQHLFAMTAGTVVILMVIVDLIQRWWRSRMDRRRVSRAAEADVERRSRP